MFCSLAEPTDGPRSVKPPRAAPDLTRLPVPTGGSCPPRPRDPSRPRAGAGHAAPSSGPALAPAQQPQQGPCVPQGQFFALAAEADDSRMEELSARTPFGNRAGGMEPPQGAAGRDPVPEHLEESLGKAPGQRGHARGSLDELWVMFLARQRRQQQQDPSRSSQLSLVERLERLARLLQSPITHTLAPPAAREKVPEEEKQRRKQPEMQLAGKTRSGSSMEPKGTRVGERTRVSHGRKGLQELRAGQQKGILHLHRILEQQQQLEIPSDSSSETRLSTEPSTCSTSGWDTGTSPASGDSSSLSLSLSTIDTARLLRAFGHHRLGLAPQMTPETPELAPETPEVAPETPELSPKLSPRLAQLYNAISQQRNRLEHWDEDRAVGCPQGAAGSLRKGQQGQVRVP